MLAKSLVVILAVVTTLTLWQPVVADEPEDGSDQPNGRQVALVSTSVSCVVVGPGTSDSVSVTVRLEWEGQIEQAFLRLAAVGSEARHSIFVNNQFVGSTPIRPGDQPCQAESLFNLSLPTEAIPIAAEVLAQGENVITLTNDANVNDGWTAADLYLEIHGVLSGPSVGALKLAQSSSASQEVGVAAVLGQTDLVSSYDGISQTAYYQIPGSYDGITPLPLLIGLHGKGGDGEEYRDLLAPEAEERGWLLAAPDMHGSYYTNTGQHAHAWPGAQHDVIDTIEYMRTNYKVDPSRIYLAGGSMGGQTSTMVTAKYPDIIAAATAWKPLTDLAVWYVERMAIGLSVEFIENETGGLPGEVPFEYERRSPLEIPQNSRLAPIKMWHDVDDLLVPIHHSQDLRDAINSWAPPTPVTLIEIASASNNCTTDPLQHCYVPNLNNVFDYLQGFTLNSQPPVAITVRTDESKPYYWLNVAQTGDDHWSQVETAYDLANQMVTATISDTHPLTLGINLGSLPLTGSAGIFQAGIGLPDGTYQVVGGGNCYQTTYMAASGYLTVTLTTTGQYTLTIAAIDNLPSPPCVNIHLPVVVK